jgi:hypothetical protein
MEAGQVTQRLGEIEEKRISHGCDEQPWLIFAGAIALTERKGHGRVAQLSRT